MATVCEAQIVCYGGRICCRWIEEITVVVHFSCEGCVVVDRDETLLEVNCGGGWGESNDDGDGE